MDKKAGIKRIWQDRFNDSRQWMDMVFARIYNDSDAMTLTVDSEVVSSLILRQLDYNHIGNTMKAGYIYGAATHRKSQGRGYMTQLMKESLNKSFRRGEAVCFLHPARRPLFSFYARFGFATAVYIDEQRYTSLHKFTADNARYDVDTTIYDIDRAAEAYNRIASLRPSSMLHDASDFKTILIDNSIDNGYKAIVTDKATGLVSAIAFARCNDNENSITVSDLTAADSVSESIALKSIRQQCGNKTMVVDAYPKRTGTRYEARGMARIVNTEKFFEAIAPLLPDTETTVKVTDPIIEANNAVFIISRDSVNRLPYTSGRHTDATFIKPDLDVSIDVLTAILFSSQQIGSIFNLPTARPYISLLLG